MAVYRKVPGFYGKDHPIISYLAGVISLLIGLPLLIGLIHGLLVSSKTTLTDWFGWLVACVFGGSLCTLLILAGNRLVSEGAFNQKARRAWFRTAETVQTKIVEVGKVEHDLEYDAYTIRYSPADPLIFLLEDEV